MGVGVLVGVIVGVGVLVGVIVGVGVLVGVGVGVGVDVGGIRLGIGLFSPGLQHKSIRLKDSITLINNFFLLGKIISP